MKRKWNLSIEAGLVTSVVAFLSYYFVFVRWPITRDFPWVNLLLFAAGLGLAALGAARAYKHPERYRGKVRGPLFGLLSVAIAAFFYFTAFVMPKQMPAASRAPATGQVAPDFTLPDVNGKPVTLSSLYAGGKNRWVLLVFYRGYW